MKFNIILISAFAALSIATSCTEVKRPNDIGKHIDTTKVDSILTDTVVNKFDADAAFFAVSRELNITKDSLDILRENLDFANLQLLKVVKTRDSVIRVNIDNKEKLAVAEYKILRIREYNRIAAQGNNLKYLRGWIIRTLNH